MKNDERHNHRNTQSFPCPLTCMELSGTGGAKSSIGVHPDTFWEGFAKQKSNGKYEELKRCDYIKILIVYIKRIISKI